MLCAGLQLHNTDSIQPQTNSSSRACVNSCFSARKLGSNDTERLHKSMPEYRSDNVSRESKIMTMQICISIMEQEAVRQLSKAELHG